MSLSKALFAAMHEAAMREMKRAGYSETAVPSQPVIDACVALLTSIAMNTGDTPQAQAQIGADIANQLLQALTTSINSPELQEVVASLRGNPKAN